MLSYQVHSAWDLTKVKDIENTIAEVGDVKISFADFKTIDHRANVDEDRMPRGWLNDQVSIVPGVLTHFFSLHLPSQPNEEKTASCLWKRQVKLMKLLFKILSLKVINASFQIIQADAQKEVRAEILRANASGFIAILN